MIYYWFIFRILTKLLYNYDIHPSFHMSVCKLMGWTQLIFSAPYFIPRSVDQATKGINVKIWNVIFSAPNWDKQLYFFLCTFLLYKSIYSMFCPSVCWSGYKRHKCKNIETPIFRLIFKIDGWFSFAKVHLINDQHLFCKYLTVCLLVSLKKIWM